MKLMTKELRFTLVLMGGLLLSAHAADTPVKAEIKDLSISGGITNGLARLTIDAVLNGLSYDADKLIHATTVRQGVRVSTDKLAHTFAITLDILQGQPKEVPLALAGDGEIIAVTGAGLQDWSIRQSGDGTRFLVLRFPNSETPITQFKGTVTARTELKSLPAQIQLLTLTAEQPALSDGLVAITTDAGVSIETVKAAGLVPMEPSFLPEEFRKSWNAPAGETHAYRFHGGDHSMSLQVRTADPEDRRIVLRDFKLVGQLDQDNARFTLSATARVQNPKGGRLELLSGGVALTDFVRQPDWRLQLEDGRYVLVCEKAGEFPVVLHFSAAVQRASEWNSVQFHVAPATLQPVKFKGFADDTEFRFEGAAKPERMGDEFTSYLPSDGMVKLSWKSAQLESQGKLFYSAELLSQINVGPGLMTQTAWLECKVMQGELDQITLRLAGKGEVTRVQGDSVLAWTVEPVAGSTERRLRVRLNQPQKDGFTLMVQTQTPVGTFPQSVNVLQIRPEGATRFAGYHRISNEGAVRLEVVDASGLSQVAPEQFPESDATQSLLRAPGSQRFVYRFSGADYTLRIQADNILPELSVSEVLAYRLGETEMTIDAELEFDIREAPVRELLLHLPSGYAIARLNASGLSDYFLREGDGDQPAELRLVYGEPVSGRQIIQLRLERNQTPVAAVWTLQRIDVLKARSTRGHVGVAAEAGFRLTPERTQGLTEIATAFFPAKLSGIQAGFRVSDPAWQATVRVERLPQTVQADVFHLFSIGEGIAYGSSTMNFLISGAPVSTFRVELSDEYFNVEFAGKDLRNWQKTNGGYVVQLHTPISGAYTLLATYERPFKSQGETLTFVGARPLDAQSEQGHTIVVSAYQFQVNPVNVSPGLLKLEPAEVQAKYRLFFDSPILAAYRYTSRPFNLQLELSPLQQGETVSLVVDRASLNTRVSKEGQVVTDARYFLKNRGNPHLRLALPQGMELWSALVNGAPVVPVKDGQSNLIPLPQHTHPDALLTLDLKLASRSQNPGRVQLSAPVVEAPVLLAEWKIQPDTGQRLVYRKGTLTPTNGLPDVSGFAGLAHLFTGWNAGEARRLCLAVLVLIGLSVWLFRWAGREGVRRFSARHWSGGLLALAGVLLVTLVFLGLGGLAGRQEADLPRELTLLAPVQQAGSELHVTVDNLKESAAVSSRVGSVWPLLLAIALWIYSLATSRTAFKPWGWILGWTLLGWSVLNWQNGAPAFLGLLWLFLCLQIVLPGLRRWFAVAEPPPEPPNSVTGKAAATALLLAGLFLAPQLAHAQPVVAEAPPLAESVTQEFRVEEEFAFATARIHWQAEKGQLLPVLYEPAVLTGIRYPSNSLKLVQAPAGSTRAHQLLALSPGGFDIELEYQVGLQKWGEATGFRIPTHYGLVNQVKAIIVNRDVDLAPQHAVAVTRTSVGSNTVAELVFAPARDAWLGWKPRSRDVRTEKPVFYAELHQLYVPSAGVIEGLHHVLIHPAQGELNELLFEVPEGVTITDVLAANPQSATRDQQSSVSLWRFDPDARQLRVQLSPPQSKPFTLQIRSQIASGPLPVMHKVGLLAVRNAAGQIGLLGVGTGSEVQLDDVTAETLSPINLDDFPAGVVQSLRPVISGLTLRRAFRYSDPGAEVTLSASPVEPDVRVATQQTLSLGEDRAVLAVTAQVNISRAGIFRLSFVLPEGLDVESVSGDALSHWTELNSDAGRIVTLHLKGKTEGQQSFNLSLTGPGVKTTQAWAAPQFRFRGATKQQGQLAIVPEQGMRLQVASRNGVTQLDPQKAGIRQKGVLAFRLLQGDWALSLDIEQVDAWVQVTSLQHFNVAEAQVKVAANLQYQIENTGLKSFRVSIPTNAESVRMTGDQLADFLPTEDTPADGLQNWEVKLHRRVIGRYLLQINYQLRIPDQATVTALQGVQSLDVNLQRGFVTLQAGGRLQIRVDSPPEALQPAEWQSIPRALQQDMAGFSANYTFRLVEPAYTLPVALERHEAAQLLPARVNNVQLTSVISDEGVMLTKVRLDITPGDKRLLELTLPARARFWFSFVNDNGVWPWRESDKILIPLEQQSRTGQAVPVEFFYSSQIGTAGTRSLDLELLGPKFDLPLENIVWQVYLNEKWELTDWSGSMQLEEHRAVGGSASAEIQNYLKKEQAMQQQQTQAAEQWLDLGNRLLQTGDPQQARQAFQNAYGLSQHDDAFNEDARVQLHNLKVQQALVGLNLGQAAIAGDEGEAAGALRELRTRKGGRYTQEEAQQIFASNNAEDNANFTRLAEKIIQQQDAAVTAPAAIRATIPEQGRLLTFRRTVEVNKRADMQIELKATAVKVVSFTAKLGTLFAAFVAFGVLLLVSRVVRVK